MNEHMLPSKQKLKKKTFFKRNTANAKFNKIENHIAFLRLPHFQKVIAFKLKNDANIHSERINSNFQ